MLFIVFSRFLIPQDNFAVCPFSALDKNFNPRNTICIPAVKIFIRLANEQTALLSCGINYIFLRLNYAGQLRSLSDFGVG